MMNKKRVLELVEKALLSGNPYKEKSVLFFFDKEERYIFAGEVFTADQLDNEYRKTAEKDIVNGYNERSVGYYDKWYRYTRADQGRAYDLGVREAANNEKCTNEMHIIECIH